MPDWREPPPHCSIVDVMAAVERSRYSWPLGLPISLTLVWQPMSHAYMTTNDVLVLVILAIELLILLLVPNLSAWMTTSRWTQRQISRPTS